MCRAPAPTLANGMRFRQRVTASTRQGETHASRDFRRNASDPGQLTSLKPETFESLCRGLGTRKRKPDRTRCRRIACFRHKDLLFSPGWASTKFAQTLRIVRCAHDLRMTAMRYLLRLRFSRSSTGFPAALRSPASAPFDAQRKIPL